MEQIDLFSASLFDENQNGESLKMSKVTANLNEVVSLQETISEIEKTVKELKQKKRFLETETLPNLFHELGLVKIESNKAKGILDIFIYGSLPKDPDKRESALGIIKSHDGGDLISSKIELVFPKGKESECEAACTLLESQGFAPLKTKAIHHMTLKSWVRKKIRDGEDITVENLGLFIGDIVKVKAI